ncbi:MAG: hypothetical protein IT348_06755 [Candidatus Eisenbacteria bacterium]|nr:hypothetical protein [Candidatus Eisenbacteria bacterium]
MRPGVRSLLAAAALCVALAPPSVAAVVPDPGCGVATLALQEGVRRYRLPHAFVRAGSDSLWTRARALVRGTDYLIDPLRGDLRLLFDSAPGESLWVRFCWLAEPPPFSYSRQQYATAPRAGETPPADSAAAGAVARPSTGRDIGQAPSGAALAVTGNKTVAVEFGSSQDAALRQSLDLAVSGTLAPGVELTGVLTDRNLPLSAAGSTQDLQSLDRVLIELRAPHASASLGDVPLAITTGEFGRLERRVEGVRGEWMQGGFRGSVAAASSQGEFHRMQFSGVDGLQGPYTLTDRQGGTGVTIVAGSEVVTLDGTRLTRGEGADYSLDYERARLTFSNRRAITSASRITVEYQYALTRYRRNIAAASALWQRGAYSLFATALNEGDDRGRPLDVTFDAADRLRLAEAGDDPALAVGEGVTFGSGDYDSVRVTGDTLAYAYAGTDSGAFSVRFVRVAAGSGDYLDSSLVAGRTTYRWVGSGRGSFVIGRALPLPESRRLVTLGGSVTRGGLRVDAEGALSRRDLNSFSAFDDEDDTGAAGRVSVALEGAARVLPGRAGLQLGARSVERRFTSFSTLERPFAEEDWGLPLGADLEHQKRTDASAWWRPGERMELRAEAARLSTPDGYSGTRRRTEWTSDRLLHARASFLDAAGDLAGRRFSLGGRQRAQGELRWPGRTLTPSLRAERDVRRTPSDVAALRDVAEEWGADLANGSQGAWRWSAGLSQRRDWHEAGTTTETRARSVRAGGETPAGRAVTASLNAQRRVTRDVASGASAAADLASARMRAERREWGLSGEMNVEVTGEAENRRVRALRFVGAGRGAYDSLGNFVGTGDYDLVLTVSPELDRFARVATSARGGWRFGESESWRGSRVDFTLETEARRRGSLQGADLVLSTGLALVDPALVRGVILQRLETELAPGSRAAALRLRAERRVSADRTYANFAQTTDQRSGSVRWRARPSAGTVLESEARVQWQRATQAFAGGASFTRTVVDETALSQLVWQPGTRLRAAGTVEAGFSRPLGQTAFTRTIRLGPDLGVSIGPRGRAELSARRAVITGPPAVSVLPSADPAGAARWDATARFDLRLHESTTFGLSAGVKERPGSRTLTTGRAEVRSFF